MDLFKTLCVAALLTFGQAQAALISVEFDKTQYQVGDTIVSKLYLSDFSGPLKGASLSLGVGHGFALDSWQLTDAFDDGLGDYRFGDFVAGQLFLEAYADWAAALNVLADKQKDRFLLATVSFKALSAGVFQFSIDQDYSGVVDGNGDFATGRLSAAALSVAPASAVSAPATGLLLAAGCWLLAGWRRRHTAV